MGFAYFKKIPIFKNDSPWQSLSPDPFSRAFYLETWVCK